MIRMLPIIVFALTLLVACGAPAATPPVPTATGPASSRPAWEQEWDRTVAAAKKEGRLVIYTTTGADVNELQSKAMKEKYGIDIQYVAGRGADLVARISAERRAGLYLGDLFTGGATTLITDLKPAGMLAPLKPLLLLPEILDQKAYFDDKLPFLDKEQNFIIVYGPAVAQTLAINADLVKGNEVKNYDDLLAPKWKERIVMYDPIIPGTAHEWFYVIARTKGMDYHRQLVKQKPMVLRDKRLPVEWLARGKYPIALASSKEVFAEFKAAGARIDWVPTSEGAYLSGTGTLAHYDRAPHPNASRVFVNWLLSKDGLTRWSQVTQMMSPRKDVPTDFLHPDSRRDPRAKYFDTNTEEVKLEMAEYSKFAREIYGSLLQ